ncbi:MAG: winged helix-turn-helix domain-containing protein [Phycisphaerales bacterium]|nr:winged helix-turn-helix domain-containing protein [Phycisphaerales bacterium]
MKNSEITLGGTYLAKITDKVVPVRIDATNPHGGWDATNLATGKKVRIKSAQRLRGPAPDRQAKQRTRAVAEAQAADAAANAHAVPAETTAPAKPAKTKKDVQEAKPKKVSGLDAAFEVLKAKGEPMTCQAIVDEMLAKGMWKTDGKTPAATIYSAIIREIDTKPGESRFAKTGRGLFKAA